jgi:hypothetical protein
VLSLPETCDCLKHADLPSAGRGAVSRQYAGHTLVRQSANRARGGKHFPSAASASSPHRAGDTAKRNAALLIASGLDVVIPAQRESMLLLL